MNTPMENQIISKHLGFIQAALGAQLSLGGFTLLNRQQIAKLVGLGNARSLASSINRGCAKNEVRWIAFKKVVGVGKHKVEASKIARWMAVVGGELEMHSEPARAAEYSINDAMNAMARPGRVHRCEG